MNWSKGVFYFNQSYKSLKILRKSFRKFNFQLELVKKFSIFSETATTFYFEMVAPIGPFEITLMYIGCFFHNVGAKLLTLLQTYWYFFWYYQKNLHLSLLILFIHDSLHLHESNWAKYYEGKVKLTSKFV